jgi:hypothetical protein
MIHSPKFGRNQSLVSREISSLHLMLLKSFVFLSVCAGVVLLTKYYVYLMEPQPLHLLKPSVIVYTSTTYHQEVAAALCCNLHDLGYDVITYLPPKIDLENAISFYGHCVHSWMIIGQQEYEVLNPQLLIFTSYPILIEGSLDLDAVKLVKRILAQERSTTKFAGMMHHSDVLHSHPVPDFIPRDRFTAIYLGEHTLLASRNLTTDPTAIFIYPIPPTTILNQHHSPPSPHRLPPSPQLLPTYPPTSSSAAAIPQHHHHHRLYPLIPFVNPHHFPILVVQGHFGGVHSWRRDHHSFLLCLRESQKQLNISGTKVNFIGFGELDFTSQERDALKLHHFSHLEKAKEFYRKIAQGNYLALTDLDDEYYYRRATSSIPTALLTGLPPIMDQHLLLLYPCLRDSSYLKVFTKKTFCESLDAVMRISQSEWEKLVMEVHHCRKVFTEDAEKKFELLLSE